MIKKLRAKFVIVNMILVTIMLIVIIGLIFHFTRIGLVSESMRIMQFVASSRFQEVIPEEYWEDINLPYFVLEMDRMGTVVATGGGYYDLSDKEFVSEVMSDALESEYETGVIQKYNLRFLRIRSGVEMKIVYVDTSTEQAVLASLMQICVFVGVLAFLAFWGLSFFIARWAIKPVADAWDRQKQFVADASHELKTPLTVILTNAELLQSPEYDQEDRQKFVGSILQMARQMRSLVERLLTLARMDNNAANMEMEELNFSDLVEGSLLPFEPVYFERGLTLESNIRENILVSGSREHLCQVMDILLDNAMKYSTAPGSVWVFLKRQGNHCRLAVSNLGEPIEKGELEHIFKRFYRVDKARSRDGSMGLGLPIAMSIVAEHKGKLWAESSGGYNTFFLELPMI